jgi:hypothetical protein
MMTITVEIPDVLAGVLSAEGRDPARAVLEAMALEGYRADWLTGADLKELLGFENPNGSVRLRGQDNAG